jgi:hypothetical protein
MNETGAILTVIDRASAWTRDRNDPAQLDKGRRNYKDSRKKTKWSTIYCPARIYQASNFCICYRVQQACILTEPVVPVCKPLHSRIHTLYHLS